MAKKVSAEEKRQRLLELFYETKEFFTLKELESIAPKRKGIVYKTVKEVLDSLVNDDLVRSEKLGVSNYFWSFPSQKIVAKKKLLDSLEKENASLIENLTNLNEKIMKEEKLRESKERNELIDEFEKRKEEERNINEELKMYQKCDPVVFKEKNDQISELKKEINGFIDKIYELQSFCGNKFGMDNSTFCENFNIPEDLDYIN